MHFPNYKPKKLFKNFKAYLEITRNNAAWTWKEKHKNNLKPKDVPCPRCEGFGKIHHEEDYDLLEGWKSAPLYTCPKCYGSYEGSIDDLKERYKGHCKDYVEKLKDWEEKKDRYKTILDKLTDDEIAFLNLSWILREYGIKKNQRVSRHR